VSQVLLDVVSEPEIPILLLQPKMLQLSPIVNITMLQWYPVQRMLRLLWLC